jgi:hypothetical protein
MFQGNQLFHHQPHPRNQLEWIGVHMNLKFSYLNDEIANENNQCHIHLWSKIIKFEFSHTFVGYNFHTYTCVMKNDERQPLKQGFMSLKQKQTDKEWR